MRWQLTVSVALIACADDARSEAEQNLRCEQGPMVLQDAIDALVEAGPGCTRDDECVLKSTDVRCEGFEFGSCGTPMHRDAEWDAAAVCREIERLPAERGLVCVSSPSCAQVEPACIASRCSVR